MAAIFNKENLGFGFMGNGLTVWDRTIEERGDYKKVARIQGTPNKSVSNGDDVDIKIYAPNAKYGEELKKYFEGRKEYNIKSISIK